MKHETGCALIVPRWKLRVSGLSGAESGFGAAVFGELTFPHSLSQPRHTRIAKIFGCRPAAVRPSYRRYPPAYMPFFRGMRVMPHYRAFQLDETGHVMGEIELSCANDDEAKEQAVQLSLGGEVEVWHLDRMVAVVRSKTDSR